MTTASRVTRSRPPLVASAAETAASATAATDVIVTVTVDLTAAQVMVTVDAAAANPASDRARPARYARQGFWWRARGPVKSRGGNLLLLCFTAFARPTRGIWALYVSCSLGVSKTTAGVCLCRGLRVFGVGCLAKWSLQEPSRIQTLPSCGAPWPRWWPMQSVNTSLTCRFT